MRHFERNLQLQQQLQQLLDKEALRLKNQQDQQEHYQQHLLNQEQKIRNLYEQFKKQKQQQQEHQHHQHQHHQHHQRLQVAVAVLLDTLDIAYNEIHLHVLLVRKETVFKSVKYFSKLSVNDF